MGYGAVGYATWLGSSGFKQFVIANSLSVQRNDEGNAWYVFAADSGVIHETRIFKDSGADQTDFEATFDALAGRPITATTSYSDRTTETPRTSDGKQIILSNIFPGNVYAYYTGSGDNTGYGDGPNFALSRTINGTETVEFNFKDWVYIAGGGLIWDNAKIGDWLSLKIYAPATPVTANPLNTGNCNLVDPGIGAAVLIVPAAANGAYDVDLSLANPVPATTTEESVDGTGYYSWNNPDTGKGTVSVGAPGSSSFYLFSINIDLVRLVNKIQILGAHLLALSPSVKPKKILPHWKWVVSLHNEDGIHTVAMTFFAFTARKKTI